MEQIQALYRPGGTSGSPTSSDSDDLWDTYERWAILREEQREQRRERERRASRRYAIVPGLLILSIPLMGIAGHYAHSWGVFAVLLFDAIGAVASISTDRSR